MLLPMISPAVLSLPNLLTLSRLIALPLFLALLYLGHPLWAAALFALIALTDVIDGLIARKLGQTSDLGKFLDPLADKVLIVSALIALIEVRHIPALPVILIAAREFLISALRINKVFPASIWGKVKTLSQVLAVLWLVLSWPYGVLVLWLAVILTWLSGVDYLVRR